MTNDLHARFHEAWLGMVQPVDGLVVSIPVLVEAQCMERHARQAGHGRLFDAQGLGAVHGLAAARHDPQARLFGFRGLGRGQGLQGVQRRFGAEGLALAGQIVVAEGGHARWPARMPAIRLSVTSAVR